MMITLGQIIQKGKNDYKWWVHIPTLHGMPDSQSEREIFSKYYEYEKKLNQNNGKVTTSNVPQQVEVYIEPSDHDKRFVTEASVCCFGGSKIMYNIGDTVVVGFIDNLVSKPIILGSYALSDVQSNLNGAKPEQFTVKDLNVSNEPGAFAILPMDTKFKSIQGGVEMTASDIKLAVDFINILNSAGVGTNTIIELMQKISPVIDSIVGLLPTTGGSSS